MKKIALGLTLLIGAGCTDEDPAAENDAKVVNVQITSNSFTPAKLTIRAGQTVRWTWGGGEHNVVSGTCDADGATADGIFRSGAPATGGTFDRAFPTAGTFPYYCELHCVMGMKGEIKVE